MSFGMLAALDPSALHWYALRVVSGRELWTAERLRERGLQAFAPVRIVWRYPNRYARARRKKVQKAYPLLTGYVLVASPDLRAPWAAAFQPSTVLGVVGARQGREPLRIPFAYLAPLIDEEAKHIAPSEQRYMRTYLEYGIGDTVDIDDGPFRGMSAQVVGIRGAKAQILLDVLGGPQHIDIALDALIPSR